MHALIVQDVQPETALQCTNLFQWNYIKMVFTPFKVIDFGTNWKPTLFFISELHPTLHRFRVIASTGQIIAFDRGASL